MATGGPVTPRGFGLLLARNVPLIHEKILFSLDYKTFKTCGGICKAWSELLASESVQRKAKSVYFKEMKMEEEERLLRSSCAGDAGEVGRSLSGGVDPNCSDAAGRSPLWHAARAGRGEVVRLLLGAGAEEVSLRGTDAELGETALYQAAKHGHDGIVELLLQWVSPDMPPGSLLI